MERRVKEKSMAKAKRAVFSKEVEAAIRALVRSEVKRIQDRESRREERIFDDALDSASDPYGSVDS
jgi:hypothetical protein